MSVVKSPMGLMIGFMVFVMFLMPKLVENMGKKNGLILFSRSTVLLLQLVLGSNCLKFSGFRLEYLLNS